MVKGAGWYPLRRCSKWYADNDRKNESVRPPPLPSETDSDHPIYPLATRWPRFFARTFDVGLETALVALVLGTLLGICFPNFIAWIDGPVVGQLFGMVCLPMALILDALVYRAFGNTFGKALLGLQVRTLDGKRLSVIQYLDRNVWIWVSGLALGFPLINLFTMAKQFDRLGKGQQASYDEPTIFRVRARPSGWLRKSAFTFLFLALFAGLGWLNTKSSAQESYSWENPITGVRTKIDSRWKHSAEQDDGGQQIHFFSEQTGHALVILGMEQAPGFSLDEYVREFRKGTASNMRFSDDGRFTNRDARGTWRGSGNMVASASNRLVVEILQVDSAFWRVVTVQERPYNYPDPLVEQLRGALWTTVK